MPNAGGINATIGADATPYVETFKKIVAVTKANTAQISKLVQMMGKGITKQMTAPLQQFGKEAGHIMPNFRGYLKDFSRVATGILMSQLFYRAIVYPITQAVRELWNFNQELERTEVSMKYLLLDMQDLTRDTLAETAVVAEETLRQLKILAARTPYTFQTAIQAATTLIALGFRENQLIPLMTIMADLSAATGGNADQMERLAWALGRVQQQGRLTRRELRLFVTARVPVMKILGEQLGIEQMPTGMSIPANIAVPALLQGVMKFRGAAQEMEQTMGGLISSIHDYLLFLGEDIFKDFFAKIRGYLTSIREELSLLWDVFAEFGLEGLIAVLFPEGVSLHVWQLVNILRELGKTLAYIWRITAPLRKELANLAFILINWLAKGFLIITQIMRVITKVAANTTGVMRALASALIGLMVASTTIKALSYLISTFKWMFATGFSVVRVLGLMVGLLTVLSLIIPTVQKWFSNLGNRILSLFGIQIPQSIMLTKAAIAGINTEAIDNIDWQKLIDGFSDTDDAASDAASSINDKFLASFDEVYQIPDKLDKAGAGISLEGLGDIGDIDFGLPEDVDLGLGEVEGQLQDFSITWNDIWEAIKVVARGAWDAIKIVGSGIWEIMDVTLPRIFATLPTLVAPILTTLVNLILANITIVSILLPKLLNTAMLVIVALINSILTYGTDKIAGIALVLAGMLTKIAWNLADIGLKMGNVIGDALVDGLITTLAGIGQVILSMTIRPIIDWLESHKHWITGKPFVPEGTLAEFDKYIEHSRELTAQYARELATDNAESAANLQKSLEGNVDAISTTVQDMLGLLAGSSEDFYNQTLPIFQQLGMDIAGVWTGTWADIKATAGPLLDNISDTWVTWADESGKPIWEGYWSDLVGIMQSKGGELGEKGKLVISGLTDIFGEGFADINDTVDKSVTDVNDLWDSGLAGISNTITEVNKNISTDVDKIWDSGTNALSKSIKGVESEINPTMENIKKNIISEIEATELPIEESAKTSTNAFVTEWGTSINTDLVALFESIDDLLLLQEQPIADAAGIVAQAAVDKMDEIFSDFHPEIGVSVRVPEIKIPEATAGNTIAGFVVNPEEMQTGGIVMSEMLAKLGERGTKEVVTPLTPQGIKPWAEAIVGAMQGSSPQGNIAEDMILVPMKKRDYIDLERKLWTIRKNESNRIAGRSG